MTKEDQDLKAAVDYINSRSGFRVLTNAELKAAIIAGQCQIGLNIAEAVLRLLAHEEARGEGAASIQTSGPDEWQPIATAPKDRRWLLSWEADLGYFIWRDGPGLINGEDSEPSHWMHLPAAPTGQV